MAFKQPLNQTRHDVLSEDRNIQSDSERNTTRSGMMESFGKALGVAASIYPLGRVYRGIKGAKVFSKSKNVPVVGKPNTTVKVPKTSSTQQVSYVNPKISMTAAERLRAGYSLFPGVVGSVAEATNKSNKN